MPAPNTMRVSISNGRCALRNGGRINWAINWCLCPMRRAIFRAYPSTRRRSLEKPC